MQYNIHFTNFQIISMNSSFVSLFVNLTVQLGSCLLSQKQLITLDFFCYLLITSMLSPPNIFKSTPFLKIGKETSESVFNCFFYLFMKKCRKASTVIIKVQFSSIFESLAFRKTSNSLSTAALPSKSSMPKLNLQLIYFSMYFWKSSKPT